eukprot:GHRR01036470.1.p1 GENE.GHRR01036470.1~~GHRR01036470.1.p1  ORF type:complete len:423 (+),score=100.70 GHRR01036470.1:2584-3852(+)
MLFGMSGTARSAWIGAKGVDVMLQAGLTLRYVQCSVSLHGSCPPTALTWNCLNFTGSVSASKCATSTMSITLWDLKQATYEEDVTVLTELTYTFKVYSRFTQLTSAPVQSQSTNLLRRGLEQYCCLQAVKELGQLICMANLKALNLSFNLLSNIHGIQALQQLQHIDISHNRLSSLEAIRPCTGLTYLNAGCNEISGTGALEALTALKMLALHDNAISKPSAVMLLTSLTGLQRLTLANNPVCGQQNWQQATIALLPGLQALDNSPVGSSDHADAALCAHLWQQAAAAGDMDYGSQRVSTSGSKPGASAISSIGQMSRGCSAIKGHAQREPGPGPRDRIQTSSIQVSRAAMLWTQAATAAAAVPSACHAWDLQGTDRGCPLATVIESTNRYCSSQQPAASRGVTSSSDCPVCLSIKLFSFWL